jgi:hypothetical protein
LATWTDTNANNQLDVGEFTPIGGWTQQPVVSTFAGRSIMAVGLIPPAGTFSSPSNDLFLLDLDQPPNSPTFILQHTTGAGGSPASAATSLFSVGAAGLTCYGPTPTKLDIDANTIINTDDLYTWEHGSGNRDINSDTFINAADRTLLLNFLRWSESRLLTRGRP